MSHMVSFHHHETRMQCIYQTYIYSGADSRAACTLACVRSGCCLSANPRREQVSGKKKTKTAASSSPRSLMWPRLPFKHHKQASGVMSRSEGGAAAAAGGAGGSGRGETPSANTTATGTNLSCLNYSCARWIDFPGISH